ncbi:PTS IIA-like nitrogen regulatory protein PtsN [Nitrincola schmidtii]|uniref:PTS IIA-like nitrogen regulatory protein PtsN n=1 Tax=Nitrincola schmidtii TaxID=1730894 RepID=UPI00124DA419|nr:PTS IIA-like nitrogen regulatory protein PtsN [Nitrincola schmidtii]
MPISELLTESMTRCHIDAVSKKRVLELASELLAGNNEAMEAEDVFSALLNRERLGSTGIGDGVAIPHCRLAGCEHATALLITLKEPIEFDAIDNRPVDLLCCLLVPEDAATEHLHTLAGLAEMFSQSDIREALRQCTADDELYQRFISLADKRS